MNDNIIKPYYEKRPPSPQTIVDIFEGAWKSKLPGELVSGNEAMFQDSRPDWLAQKIPGGLNLKSVLELGPFEGYQTLKLERLGAREITSVEGNSVNFLKCLCLKEALGMSASFQFGDIMGFLNQCDRKYDVVWASGVLYHMQQPIQFLERASQLAPYMFIWTHYYDDSIENLTNGQEKHFLSQHDKVENYHGRDITLHARSYLTPDYDNNVPLYWEGGLEQITYWLEKADIQWLLEQSGMKIEAILSDTNELLGLPLISFLAKRVDGS